jgi:predicted nuclease of predicted toxin-antitoxin system
VGKEAKEEPKLLIDACLTAALPEYLLHHLGIDAIRIDKYLPIDAKDEEVVVFARESGRMIATENAEDFRRLANNDPQHPGLIVIAGSVGKRRQIELCTRS